MQWITTIFFQLGIVRNLSGSVVACLVFRRRVARCSVAAGDLPKTVQEMKTELLGIRWDQLSTTRWCPQSLAQLVKKWLEVGERMGLC